MDAENVNLFGSWPGIFGARRAVVAQVGAPGVPEPAGHDLCRGVPGFARRTGQADLGPQARVFAQKRGRGRIDFNVNSRGPTSMGASSRTVSHGRAFPDKKTETALKGTGERAPARCNLGLLPTRPRTQLSRDGRGAPKSNMFLHQDNAEKLQHKKQLTERRQEAGGDRGLPGPDQPREYGTARDTPSYDTAWWSGLPMASTLVPLAIRQLRDFNPGRKSRSALCG
eukprot:s201_g16.t1